ncbi:MAG: class I SAM-dependent methyltransferase [Pirellulaceae bacterium]|nr:class I SAM-dependent methyltransferase [Pirellulaceae bacterium]
MQKFARVKTYFYTLAPEATVIKSPNASYVYGDLRELALKDACMDVVTCISTLEHVGMDNTRFYTADEQYQECDANAYLHVVDQLRRVTKPGGKVFITVPFGRSQNHGWFQQFTATMIDELVQRLSSGTSLVKYYSYTTNGWQLADQASCSQAEYFDIHKVGRKRTPDFAAAARAVACVEFVKATE